MILTPEISTDTPGAAANTGSPEFMFRIDSRLSPDGKLRNQGGTGTKPLASWAGRDWVVIESATKVPQTPKGDRVFLNFFKCGAEAPHL
jgi:hypothetical protein